MRGRPDAYLLDLSAHRSAVETTGHRAARFGGAVYLVPFTVVAAYRDATTGDPYVTVTGTIDDVDGRPTLTRVTFDAPNGWHLPSWQREWRWSWLVERGLSFWSEAQGADLDHYLANVGRRHDLTDPFLANIAATYLRVGRGYAASLAAEHVVSERTARSWVEAARDRGLLTRPDGTGAVGGRLTTRGRRALAQHNDTSTGDR